MRILIGILLGMSLSMPVTASQSPKFDFDLIGGVCPIPTAVSKTDCGGTSEENTEKHFSADCHTCSGRHCDEKHAALVNPTKKKH